MFDFADLPTTYRWAIAVWLAALGGCIGSFLNVVVYRLPAGKSLVHPGSHCPKCGHAIRWYDNVPVFGWLALRGKCRDCREPISFRYPLVEAITAALFFGLGWIELLSGGANLPPLIVVEGLRIHFLLPAWSTSDLVTTYALHLLLLCTLLAAGLIQYDGNQVPRRLFAPALLIGFTSPAIWTQVWMRTHSEVVRSLSADTTRTRVIVFLLQIAVGLTLGWVLGWFVPRHTGKDSTDGDVPAMNEQGSDPDTDDGMRGCVEYRANDSMVLATLCVSLFIPLEAVLFIGIVVLILAHLETRGRRVWRGLPRIGPLVWLALLVPIWIVFWRPLAATMNALLH